MIENSQEVILVADSQKIGQTALVKFSSWENIDLLITDRECQKKYLKEFRNLKLKVLTV
jgi:DeoR/GlpR family transcriptional regulator of sugar metabolism